MEIDKQCCENSIYSLTAAQHGKTIIQLIDANVFSYKGNLFVCSLTPPKRLSSVHYTNIKSRI